MSFGGWDFVGSRQDGAPRFRVTSAQFFVGSFVFLVVLGALGLLVLPGLYTGERLGVVDSLFTAASAVCVTGLTVVDTATYFTPLGQAWIAVLIQLGGIGILTLTTLVILGLGRRMSLDLERAGGGHTTVLSHLSQRSLLGAVVRFTFAIELGGAIVLWVLWRGRLGSSAALWPAVFHSISAFCNAGFSIFSHSLMDFRASPLTLVTVSGLIILGGLGFLVLVDLWARARGTGRGRLSLHTKIVLWSSAILLVGGTFGFLVFESPFDLRLLGMPDQVVNAWFMSATARTAGFHTVDYSTASNGSILLTLALMVIGGSPGSTAGGLKTTSVVLLVLMLWSRLRGRSHTSAFGRTIPRDTLERAAGVVIAGFLVLALFVFLLLILELPEHGELDRVHLLEMVFEAHSAFGTVGLSMGATPKLTDGGRLLITLLMFLGRVGPLAFAVSLVNRRNRAREDYRFAQEDVVVG
ncbi:MAG: potassium transporter TrkG [Candidatus Palauibacterales bacterium]|nr:potassium transporter TrkG [Candidatus Palauibacterales bacterium]